MVTIVIIFFFMFEKNTTAMSRHLLLWFCCNEEGNNTKLLSPFSMALLQKMATITFVTCFNGGGVVKKPMATIGLLFFSLVLLV
jgi:hypothetical protein